jgi:predicted DNA binding CopG/RHH family protein
LDLNNLHIISFLISNIYFWRTNSQQEIDYIEESDGALTAFEMKWNHKKVNVRFPKSFLEAYNVKETIVITPNNYLDWVTANT